MKRPWHKADPALLEKLAVEVQAVYPNLHFHPQSDRVVVRGTFPVVHDGEELDRYAVEIVLLHDYPDSIPLVFETGGRIPHHADYHVQAKTGEVCLFLADERWEVYPSGTSLLDFLDGPFRNFFLGQSLFRRTGEWPFGEHKHAADGIRDYYAKLLGTEDLGVIVGYLECLSRAVVKGHWTCPCGSGKRLRDCHRREIEELRAKIPPAVAKRSWESLRTRQRESQTAAKRASEHSTRRDP